MVVKFKDDSKEPLVSIVVLAYNHLNHTKMCVESIYEYTQDIDLELITVNNGSSDDTKQYFDSLPNKKKINIENNVGPINGFNVGMKAAGGRYIACVCNDFIFTTNWLKNLIICAESDVKIGYVSPGASSLSNLQQINGNYKDIQEMHEFARSYNISDPKKWEERVRLMPAVLFLKKELLDVVGYYDPRFIYGEFGDDDYSFRVRRAGYKIVYAGDTFTYHFGSVTTKKEHRENNSLEVSRKIFFDKYGLDAWTDGRYDLNIINFVNYKEKLESRRIDVLGIDPLCGSTILQIKNKFRFNGIENVSINAYSGESKYCTDLFTICDNVHCGDYDDIKKKFFGKKFDYIIIGKNIEYYKDFLSLLSDLRLLLKYDGNIVLTIKNPINYINFFKMVTGTTEQESFILINFEQFIVELGKIGLRLTRGTVESNSVHVEDEPFVDNIVGMFKNQDSNLIKQRLVGTHYILNIMELK